MTRGDPELSHAISMRPSPFHAHPDRVASPYRSTSHSPARLMHHEPPHTDAKRVPATSTALSADDGDNVHDPVGRPVYHRHGSESEGSDVEQQRGAAIYNHARDPYRLQDGYKNLEQEKEYVQANIKRKRTTPAGPMTRGKDRMKSHRIIKFYADQNENIERMLKPVNEHVEAARKEKDDHALQYKIAVNGSFVANVCLAVLQIYGAVSSGSLSLFTTMADAVFDPLSNITLIMCNRAVNSGDPRRFPSGKGRLETAGNIAFCFLMTSVSLILIVESIQELASGKHDDKLHIPSVIAVGIAFVTKLCLFLYCWALRNRYSQIHILWEDHRNDLFINGFGLMTSVLGSKIAWWIDPMGSIILSCLIAFLWMRTAFQEFQLLIGVCAETSFLQHVTYISMTHDPRVKALDTVRAWYSGPRLIVEIDIVMDPDMTLRETHDVSDDLQMKIESLPDVERAYVHVDYETDHRPEHFWKKEL